MFPLIDDVKEVSAAWLTDVLRASSVLSRGHVVVVRSRDNAAFNSQVAHLEVQYSSGAPVTAPQFVLVKLKQEGSGEQEVEFYRLASTMPERLPMLVRAYAAEFDADSGRSCLLLADVSPTHEPPVKYGDLFTLSYVPSATHLEQVVDAIADFHACWWNHDRSGEPDSVFQYSNWYATPAQFEEWCAKRHQHWAHFIAAEGSWYPPELRRLYETALENLPRLRDTLILPRIASGHNLTLVNGDCYFGQFLCPRAGTSGSAYMVDLESVCTDFAALDLVYLFATFWTREQRQTMEQAALQRYHRRLMEGGVRDYSWDALCHDYRLMLSLMIFPPVWDQTYLGSGEKGKAYWWPKMRCLTDAYQDWRCDELT